jgi:hypothetical protein
MYYFINYVVGCGDWGRWLSKKLQTSTKWCMWHLQFWELDGWIWCCSAHPSKSITNNNASTTLSRDSGWLLCMCTLRLYIWLAKLLICKSVLMQEDEYIMKLLQHWLENRLQFAICNQHPDQEIRWWWENDCRWCEITNDCVRIS